MPESFEILGARDSRVQQDHQDWARQEAYGSLTRVTTRGSRNVENESGNQKIEFGDPSELYGRQVEQQKPLMQRDVEREPQFTEHQAVFHRTRDTQATVSRNWELYHALHSMESRQPIAGISFDEMVEFQRSMHNSVGFYNSDSNDPIMDHLQRLSANHRRQKAQNWSFNQGSVVMPLEGGAEWIHSWGYGPKFQFDEIVYANGDSKREYPDGTGYSRNEKPGGNTEERHWGRRPEDNYVLNQFKNGDFQIRYADGRGTSVNFDEHGNAKIHSWGTEERHNFEATFYKNGDRKVQRADKTGYSLNQDSDGNYKVKHWGPQQGSNYEQQRNFTSVNASSEFVKELATTYLTLPELERSILDVPVLDGEAKARRTYVGTPEGIKSVWNGVESKVPKKPADIPEFSSSMTPTVNDSRTHWNQVPGAFSEKFLYVSETVADREGIFYQNRNASFTLRHECGHAIDSLLGDASNSDEFKRAYEMDVSELPRQPGLLYFLDGRREEAFAEIYSGLRGNLRAQPVLAAFPRAAEIVRNHLSYYGSHFPAEQLIIDTMRNRAEK